MQLKLSCHQCKIDCKVIYVSLMVITKQKPIVDIKNIKKRNLSIPLKKVIKQQMEREEKMKGTEIL